MKARIFTVMVVFFLISLVFAGCVKKEEDCAVVCVTMVEDLGAFAKFELKLNYCNEPASGSKRIAYGQSGINKAWVDYAIGRAHSDKYGILEIIWLKGEPFDFTYGNRISDTERKYIDPVCSKYASTPLNPAEGGIRLRVKMGEKEICERQTTNDPYIVGVEKLSDTEHILYLNPVSVLTYDYQKLFLYAPPAENTGWTKDRDIDEDYPCYSVKVTWPSNIPFPFTFCNRDENGNDVCIDASDPNKSKFIKDGSLSITFNDVD